MSMTNMVVELDEVVLVEHDHIVVGTSLFHSILILVFDSFEDWHYLGPGVVNHNRHLFAMDLQIYPEVVVC